MYEMGHVDDTSVWLCRTGEESGRNQTVEEVGTTASERGCSSQQGSAM